MSQFDEANTTQAAIVNRLGQSDLGWSFLPGDELPRTPEAVLIVDHLVDTLVRLNPPLAESPDRVNEVLPKLRAVLFAVGDDGLIATNEHMMSWLRGTETHRFVGTDQPVPITMLDFDDPRSNQLVVSTEVTYGAADRCRYDIVLFINGIPLVVGETKTPIKGIVSWLDAAKDIDRRVRAKDARVLRPQHSVLRVRGQRPPLRSSRPASRALAALGPYHRRGTPSRDGLGIAVARVAAGPRNASGRAP